MEMLPHKQVHYVSFNYSRSNSQRSKITTPLPVPVVVVGRCFYYCGPFDFFSGLLKQPRQTCCRFESILDPIKFKTVPLRSHSTLTVLLSKKKNTLLLLRRAHGTGNRRPSSVQLAEQLPKVVFNSSISW